LVDSVESMRMHGLPKPKLHDYITIRLFTAALYDISLDVARVYFFCPEYANACVCRPLIC